MAQSNQQSKQLPAQSKEREGGKALTVVQQAADNPPQAFLALGHSAEKWAVMCNAFFPKASSPETVLLVAQYCHAQELDLMNKPFHIVTLNGKDSIWPSINLHETKAHRTGELCGIDKPKFSEETEPIVFQGGIERKMPVSVEVTVYRYNHLTKAKEAYTAEVDCREFCAFDTQNGYPNDRWNRAYKQMAGKCALAAALRMAFPEQTGSHATAEEMEHLDDRYQVTVMPEPTPAMVKAGGRSGRVRQGEVVINQPPHEEKPAPKPADDTASSVQTESTKEVQGEVVDPPEDEMEEQKDQTPSTTEEKQALLVALKPGGWTGKKIHERITIDYPYYRTASAEDPTKWAPLAVEAKDYTRGHIAWMRAYATYFTPEGEEIPEEKTT